MSKSSSRGDDVVDVPGTVGHERLQSFFAGLSATLDTARDARNQAVAEHEASLRSFFSGLAPAIAMANEAQRRLDRVAATSFSVFHYFRENEHRMSAIFADLLRPDGRHGQGTTFLRLFLEEIDRGKKDCIRKRSCYESLEQCSVHTEYVTSERRLIDIVLELGNMWIGIENKPWAGEQPEQVQHYLCFLQEQKKDERACVLYLSGSGEDAKTIEDDKRRHYLTIPYNSYTNGNGPSVAHWIAECWSRCEADQVRWFLKDLHEYVKRSFNAELPSAESEE